MRLFGWFSNHCATCTKIFLTLKMHFLLGWWHVRSFKPIPLSTQDFCQKLGWGDALLTERATANPFFLEPEIGLCDKPQWTVFLAKNSGLLQWKQRLKFATMTICSTYIFVRLVCDLSNELNTNDDKFTHKMILLSYRKKTWISCYCKKALNSLSLKNE